MHKVNKVSIFVMPKFGNKVISHIYFILMCFDQFHFVVKLFQLVTVSILFLLESYTKIPKLPNLCIAEKLEWRNALLTIRIPTHVFCEMQNRQPVSSVKPPNFYG